MKILVDQNISFRVLPLLPDSPNYKWLHVKVLGLMHEPDTRIWKYASENNFNAILTADQDFYRLLLEKGSPPKIIRLRIGNGSNQRIAEFVSKNQFVIDQFLGSEETDYLEISNSFS
jgi:predicted nuclease of predicted toxin-antitoxin system